MPDNNDNLKNAQVTFPLASTDKIDKDSDVTIPNDADIKEAKDWVDFKEM